MRNYSIYACSVTIRIVAAFAILAFAYEFDFPPFMILIIALLNDGTIMTLSVDRVLPSMTPDQWDLAEIFSYALAYGIWLTLSTIAFFMVIWHTTFFEDKFRVDGYHDDVNNNHIHMILYLQVAIISQALIFVTRSHGFSFTERPSIALMVAFCIAQLISSIIAGFGNWYFTDVEAISGGWIGIVWVWNIVWYFPLDLIKFAMKATVIKYLRERREKKIVDEHGQPLQRTTSRAASIHESLYSNRVNFLSRAVRTVGFGKGRSVRMSPNELQRFGSLQAAHAGATLARHPSRPAVPAAA